MTQTHPHGAYARKYVQEVDGGVFLPLCGAQNDLSMVQISKNGMVSFIGGCENGAEPTQLADSRWTCLQLTGLGILSNAQLREDGGWLIFCRVFCCAMQERLVILCSDIVTSSED